jgi:hypothetical protein
MFLKCILYLFDYEHMKNKLIDCTAHINRRKVVAVWNNIVSVVLFLTYKTQCYTKIKILIKF